MSYGQLEGMTGASQEKTESTEWLFEAFIQAPQGY